MQLELRHAQYQDRPGAYPVPLPERVLRDPAVDQNVVAALTALEQMPKMWGGQAGIADRALAEAMRVVTKSGRVFEFMMVAELQVVSLGLRGRFEDALAPAQEALEVARHLGGPHGSGTSESVVVTALTANGRYDEAQALMRAGLAGAGAAGKQALRTATRPCTLACCQPGKPRRRPGRGSGRGRDGQRARLLRPDRIPRSRCCSDSPTPRAARWQMRARRSPATGRRFMACEQTGTTRKRSPLTLMATRSAPPRRPYRIRRQLDAGVLVSRTLHITG